MAHSTSPSRDRQCSRRRDIPKQNAFASQKSRLVKQSQQKKKLERHYLDLDMTIPLCFRTYEKNSKINPPRPLSHMLRMRTEQIMNQTLGTDLKNGTGPRPVRNASRTPPFSPYSPFRTSSPVPARAPRPARQTKHAWIRGDRTLEGD